MSEKQTKKTCPRCGFDMLIKTFFAFNQRFRVYECLKCGHQEFPKQTIINGFLNDRQN